MQIGEIFEGKYKILKMLGQGGMSSVYLCENIKLNTLWAIKKINKNSNMKIDFLVEPNILKKLDHPSLPKIFDIVEDRDSIFIVVDYIEGTSLDKELARQIKISESTVLNWAKQLCDVLHYLHTNEPNPIIYRDMKPSNIILTKTGTLKLIDFGIAREFKAEATNDTVFIGTRGFAAPEQYGSGQTSEVSDIYSLGVTIYSLLTGKYPNEPPYEIKPVRSIDKTLSKEIESIIQRCVRQNPADRYQSIKEILIDMDAIAHIKSASPNPLAEGPKVNILPFKKLVLTVWDNAEFGCEFAYVIAKQTDHRVLLVDLDLLAPKVDLQLNVKKYVDTSQSDSLFGNSGLNLVMDSIEKNFLSSDIFYENSIKRRECKNLFILTGNYKIENYEYYRDESLLKLIEEAYRTFEVTVLLVNSSIYDSFTVLSLAKSDFNIVAIRADVEKLRETNRYLMFLKDKQNISMNKTKFVAFEYEKAANITLNEMNIATKDNCIGKLNYSRRRSVYRNMKVTYARHMEKQTVKDYTSILTYFNIVPRLSLINKFKRALSRR